LSFFCKLRSTRGLWFWRTKKCVHRTLKVQLPYQKFNKRVYFAFWRQNYYIFKGQQYVYVWGWLTYTKSRHYVYVKRTSPQKKIFFFQIKSDRHSNNVKSNTIRQKNFSKILKSNIICTTQTLIKLLIQMQNFKACMYSYGKN
jgi:hypothetical protein